MEPENLAHLKQQLSEQIHGLRFTDALETKKTILQRQPDFDFDGFVDVDRLGCVLLHYGYSQADAARHVDLAFALLRQHKVHFEQYAMLIDDDLEDSGIFVSLRVRADIEQTLVMSDELYRILDESIEDWNPAHLSVAIDPFVANE